jgi:MFS family permease
MSADPRLRPPSQRKRRPAVDRRRVIRLPAFLPHRPQIFYGWYVLAATVVVELFGLGFGIFAITTVYPYIIDAFPSWSRTLVFAPTSIIILTVGAMAPLTGAFIDRFPIQVLFVCGIAVQSTALFLFSRIGNPFQYIAVSVLLGFGMSGVTILPSQVLVARWFHARVGLVNGILLAATALGAAIAPALITRIIEASDWRSAFQWMSVAAFVPPLVAVLTVMRERPESIGLTPYGSDAETVATASAAFPAGATLRQALGSRGFWIFAAVIFLGGLPCYSHNKHILVYLKELGFGRVEAADYKSFLFFVAACGRVLFGWVADHADKRKLLITITFLIAIGYPLLLLVPDHRDLLMPSLFLFGLGYGGLLPAIPILAVHYFGRAHLGKVLGAYKIVYDLAAAGAPVFTAQLYDRYGGYDVPQRWLSGFAVAGLLFALAMPSEPQTPATG